MTYSSQSKPDWIRVRSTGKGFSDTFAIIQEGKIKTVCEEAACPNLSTCWSRKHAAFIIMGDTCTRACAFCNIKTGKPSALDPFEPFRLAKTVSKMELSHVVITSVDRDDLEDGGAAHFLKCISLIKELSPNTTIEILTPDFRGKAGALEIIALIPPDVFNHNIETVPRNYIRVRPGARYFDSLRLLQNAKELMKSVFTKSGIMLGLGETKDEVMQVMDDLRSAEVDFLTIGQYLQPTYKHAEVSHYPTPEEYNEYKSIAMGKGFLLVDSSPLTRSSYHADLDFKILKDKKDRKISV